MLRSGRTPKVTAINAGLWIAIGSMISPFMIHRQRSYFNNNWRIEVRIPWLSHNRSIDKRRELLRCHHGISADEDLSNSREANANRHPDQCSPIAPVTDNLIVGTSNFIEDNILPSIGSMDMPK